MSQLICSVCSLEFKSRSGLWKHSKKHMINDQHNNKTIYSCKYCKKELSDRHSRWKHETKVCKMNPEKQVQYIQSNGNEIINNNINNSTNNTINNNIQTQNNNITNIQTQNIINIQFNKLGNEDISILTQNEIEEIINNGLNSIIKMVEFINFNNAYPQNHTFCTTNLHNKYTSVLNPDTNKIDTARKVDVYDKVLYYALQHINLLKKKITDKKKRKTFKEKIDELEKNIFGQVKYKQIFIEQLNALSYNKREMIENTWAKYISLII